MDDVKRKKRRFIISIILCGVIALTLYVMVMYIYAYNRQKNIYDDIVETKELYEDLVEIRELPFIETCGKELVTDEGNTVILKGTNAGGWLLQELWMTPTEESQYVKAENDIYITLKNRFGTQKMKTLLDTYMDAYWTEDDFKNCSDIGFNCIRLPFWYRNLVDENGMFYGYDDNKEDPYKTAFERIDWFISTANKYGMYVLLDFHGAPGSQNGSDHSGLDGGNNKQWASEFFWGDNASANQELYYEIWEVIATRYKDVPGVAGYDLLNEPFSSYRYNSDIPDAQLHQLLWSVYDNVYGRIREVDTKHIVIMEGIWTPGDLPNPDEYGWENVMYEYHSYCNDDLDNKNNMQIMSLIDCIDSINNKGYNVPSYIGEFCLRNSIEAWDEGLKIINESKISWTTWTYRVMPYYQNWGLYLNDWTREEVNVEYDSYNSIKKAWKKVGDDIANEELIAVLKKYCN